MEKFNLEKYAEEAIKKKNEEQKKVTKTKIIKKKLPSVTPKMFIERFKSKFGETISPIMDEYVDTQKEINFKCNICGHVFRRRPYNCLISNGCPKCHPPHNQKLTTEEFIERANAIHNNRYDYSKVKYESFETPVIIICHEKDKFGDEHGEFKVTPHAHIGSMKSGCPKCSGKFRKDTEYFIKEAKLIHGNAFIYDKTKYEKALKPVIITCPEHGDFKQTPNDHLNGRGCPLCKESHLEKNMRLFLNKNKIKYIPQAGFDWLRTDDTHKKMSLDFYIEDKKIAIECQGIQHFDGKYFWPTERGKEKEFLRIQERDELKKKLCEEHGIRIIYYSNLGIDYPYQVFEDKEELLKEIINEQS